MYVLNGKVYGCPIEAVSNLLGKKWVAQIIWNIKDESKHFAELKRNLKGCSTKMLVQQLRLLEGMGIVENKKDVSNNEVSSIYYLTEKGLSIVPILKSIIEWGNSNLDRS